MKKALLIFFLTILSACSSKPSKNACTVKTTEGANPGEATVENNAAFVGAGCITGRFGCKWKEAKFEGDDIVIEGELASRTGKVASFKNGVLTYLPPNDVFGLAKAAKKSLTPSERFEFQKDRVVMTTEYTGLAKKISGQERGVVNYLISGACTQRDVALGVGLILAGRR
jgi:hypothetical protein